MSSEALANAVLRLYNELPDNGKPKKDSEFTVIAAICATIDGLKDPVVLSLATGTKCAGKHKEDINGYILSDGHAEVLARRGFIRWLFKNAIFVCENCEMNSTRSYSNDVFVPFLKRNSDEKTCMEVPALMLKAGWKFYLFTSDSPCGDACIYPRVSIDTTGSSISGFTGAKIVRRATMGSGNSNDNSGRGGDGGSSSSVCDWEREEEQVVGALRTKSGRSDIESSHRTSSMSCSDKICRWARLGLQGALFPQLIDTQQWGSPCCRLSGVVVGLDPTAVTAEAQLSALKQTLVGRLRPRPHTTSSVTAAVATTAATTATTAATATITATTTTAAATATTTTAATAAEDLYVDVVRSFNCPSSKGEADKRNLAFLAAATATATAATAASNSSDTDKTTTTDDDIDSHSCSRAKEHMKKKAANKSHPSGNSINWIRDVVTGNKAGDNSKNNNNNNNNNSGNSSIDNRGNNNSNNSNNSSSSSKKSHASNCNNSRDDIESKRKRLKPCSGGTVEVTLADTGALQGATKSSVGTAEASSRLCRKEMAVLFGIALAASSSPPSASSLLSSSAAAASASSSAAAASASSSSSSAAASASSSAAAAAASASSYFSAADTEQGGVMIDRDDVIDTSSSNNHPTTSRGGSSYSGDIITTNLVCDHKNSTTVLVDGTTTPKIATSAIATDTPATTTSTSTVAMFTLDGSLHGKLREPYYKWKVRSESYVALKTQFLSAEPFCNWLCDDPVQSGSFDMLPATLPLVAGAAAATAKDTVRRQQKNKEREVEERQSSSLQTQRPQLSSPAELQQQQQQQHQIEEHHAGKSNNKREAENEEDGVVTDTTYDDNGSIESHKKGKEEEDRSRDADQERKNNKRIKLAEEEHGDRKDVE